MNRRTSVGHRLFLLVACQTAIALVLVLIAVRVITRISDNYRHMYNFQFKSVAAIGLALEEAVTLQPGSRSAGLDDFYRRYRMEWETASGTTPDAIRFRKDLLDAGMLDLPRHETKVLEDLGRSLHMGNAENIRKDLAALYELNLRYAALEHQYVLRRIRNGQICLVVTGVGGVTLTLFLGLYVRRAVAPRIRRLVAHVGNFRETGRYERIVDDGKDDIAVLANALDTGFSAIASREQEREQFLSIAAHELKTPVTSIHGYASLLLSQDRPAFDVRRALAAINRQSTRLSRLIDALFLAVQARPGKLHFEPRPFDMSVLVGRVLREIEPLLLKKTFQSKIQENISIFGDEALLEHALWSLFTCAATFAVDDTPLQVAFCSAGQRAGLTIDIQSGGVSIPEIQDLFTPFRFVEYETGSGIRSAIGLYLCREIVRLHNGSLRVEQSSDERPEFVMELPI